MDKHFFCNSTFLNLETDMLESEMKNKNKIKNKNTDFFFDKINYKILLIGIVVMALGFIMSGGER
jgi:hypothetical protein